MTPLRTIFYGGLGALLAMGLVGGIFLIGGRVMAGRGSSPFARYTAREVVDHYDRHGLNTKRAEKPVSKDFYAAGDRLPRDRYLIDANRSGLFEFGYFAEVLAFDNEADLNAVWDRFVEVKSRGSKFGGKDLYVARHENILLVRWNASDTYETLLYTMR